MSPSRSKVVPVLSALVIMLLQADGAMTNVGKMDQVYAALKAFLNVFDFSLEPDVLPDTDEPSVVTPHRPLAWNLRPLAIAQRPRLMLNPRPMAGRIPDDSRHRNDALWQTRPEDCRWQVQCLHLLCVEGRVGRSAQVQ